MKASQNEMQLTITEMERNQSQIKVSIRLQEQPTFLSYFTDKIYRLASLIVPLM